MHLPQIHIAKAFSNRKLDEIYASNSIRSFAVSMVSVFVPIFLYQLGFSIVRILLFYVVYHAVHALLTPPAAHFAARWGFKHAILLSTPFLILFYVALYGIEAHHGLWWLASVIGGIMSALFWIGYHMEFASVGKKGSFGEELSTIKMLNSIVSTIGPFVGGLLLTFFSFHVVFVVVSLLLVASIFPLFVTKDTHVPITFKTKDIFRNQRLRDYLALSAQGITGGVDMVIWPLFIFGVLLLDYSQLGFVTTLSFAATLLITYIAGKQTDKDRKKTTRAGSIITAGAWILRTLVKTPLQVFGVNFVYGGALSFVMIPFDATCYERANAQDIVRYTIFREIVINLARVAIFLVFMLFSSFPIMLLVAAGATLLYMFY